MDSHRINFEFTIDEAVEFQLGFVRASREGGSWRRREQLTFAAAFSVAVVCVMIVFSSRRTPLMVALSIGAATAAGLLLAIPFGWYYDHLVKARTRRFLIEQFGGDGPQLCSIEIRAEGLWVAQRGVELTFPWRDATGIQDAAEGVTVTFKGGRVLARSRGFASLDARTNFLHAVRALVPPAS
jgi:hypothetical protein